MRLLKLLNIWPPFTKAVYKQFPGQKSIEVVGASSASLSSLDYSGKTIDEVGPSSASLSDPGYSGKTIEEVGAASAETRKP